MALLMKYSYDFYKVYFKPHVSIFKRSYCIVLVDRVFANGLGDLSSIPGHFIPNTLKMVLDNPLLNTQQHKVPIKSKVEQSRERSNAPRYISV